MPHLPARDDQPELEHYLERWALKQCRPTTFVQCLVRNHIAPTIEVTTTKGKVITIQGSDIADKGTWKKFLKGLSYERQRFSFSKDGEALVHLYQAWLVREHTPRYRGMTSQTHLDWLNRVVTLVIARVISWQKYERVVAGEKDAIVDPWVANQLHQLWLLREATKDTARLIHHMIEDPDQGQNMLAQFISTLDEQLRTHVLVMPQPLPRLSEGRAHPFLLLSERQEEEDA